MLNLYVIRIRTLTAETVAFRGGAPCKAVVDALCALAVEYFIKLAFKYVSESKHAVMIKTAGNYRAVNEDSELIS